jgi:hypothetical protein
MMKNGLIAFIPVIACLVVASAAGEGRTQLVEAS